MEHEHCPLRRTQLLQHNQQRHPHTVIERDPISGIGSLPFHPEDGERTFDRRGLPLAATPGRTEQVQTQAADDHDQPASDVIDVIEIGAPKTGEGVLDRVFGITDVPEHPECEVDQYRSMLGPQGLDASVPALRLSAPTVELLPAQCPTTGTRQPHRM